MLAVDGFFWDRDSHGLFDYDSKVLTISRLKLEGCSYIAYDQNNHLKQTYPHLGNPKNYTGLLSYVWQQGNFWIFNSESLIGNEDYHHTKMAWQVVSL